MYSLGNFLDDLIRDKGISQNELAKMVGVSSSTMSRWKSGAGAPDFGNLLRLSEISGADLRTVIVLAYPAAEKHFNLSPLQLTIAQKLQYAPLDLQEYLFGLLKHIQPK